MNPYEYLLPVQKENFVGRHDIVHRICNQTSGSGGQVYAVLAGRRCGKTSLMNVIKQTLMDKLRDNPAIPVVVDMEKGFDGPEQLYSFIERKAYYQAVASWPELAKFLVKHEQDKMSNSELEENLLNILNVVKLRALPRFVLMIDEVDLVLAKFLVKHEQDKMSNSELEENLLNILNVVKLRALPRFVLMIDEVDLVLRCSWYTTLFEQLRELLSSSDAKDHLSLILFGADYFYETKEQGGSPLLNIAIPEFLYNVNRSDINDLIKIGGDCSDEFEEQVWVFSGGQPHVAQYILHHLWKPTGFKEVKASDVRKVVNQYYRDHLANLKKWMSSSSVEGRVIYDLLARSGEWMDELVLAKKAKISVSNAKTALDKLCLQGIAIIDRETYTHYKVQGDLFKHWFIRNKSELLENRIGALRANKANENSPGLAMPSPTTYIQHMEVVQQKVQANKISGNVSQTEGLKRSEITKMFKALYDLIEQRPSTTPAKKKVLTKTVKEIETNLSSEKPSRKFLEARLNNLRKMAPDILEVALAALTSPASSFKVIAEKIAAKVKADTG